MIRTDATNLVKTFGRLESARTDSKFLSDINSPELQINGSDFDIVRGMLESDTTVSNKVKDVLAVLLLEVAKGADINITELVQFSKSNAGKIKISQLSFDMINKLRPKTSKIGIKNNNILSNNVNINRHILV